MKPKDSTLIRIAAALWVAAMTSNGATESLRRILPLDGTWQIAEGKMEKAMGSRLNS